MRCANTCWPESGGEDYARVRKDYFVDLAARHKALSTLGSGRAEYYRDEWQHLQREFPPLDALRSSIQ